MTNKASLYSGSFRDPSGFLFQRDNQLYRQINLEGREDYDLLMSSGLYQKLVEKSLLIPHEEVALKPAHEDIAYKIVRPERLPFISYPYEWCFSQLKDAALTTLRIQKLALQAGMSLKDSSAYNIQFYKGRPVLIDTLSFERYQPGEPWTAYRQFCQHFLAPLALMAYVDVRLNALLRAYIDGIPLDLTTRMLPATTLLKPGLVLHLHMHARAMRAQPVKPINREAVRGKMSQTALLGLLDSLKSTLAGLDWKPVGTDWADYYDRTNYTPEGFEDKKRIVESYLRGTSASTAWDLGANTGIFSRLAAAVGMQVISFDLDPAAVEQNYRACVQDKEIRLLPLVMDLTNPSPALGWSHTERHSLLERGPVEVVLALALLHHLIIGNNLPMVKAAQFFQEIGKWLVIEFIPKSDSQVQKMLASRKDIFKEYDHENFEAAFEQFFQIVESQDIRETQRRLYLMRAK